MTMILLYSLLVDNLISADDNNDKEDWEEKEEMDFECEKYDSTRDADIRKRRELEMYQEFLTEQLEYRVSILSISL